MNDVNEGKSQDDVEWKELMDNLVGDTEVEPTTPKPSPMICVTCKEETNISSFHDKWYHTIKDYDITETYLKIIGDDFTCKDCLEPVLTERFSKAFDEKNQERYHAYSETLPKMYKDSYITNFSPSIQKAVKDWVNNDKQWSLFISGGWGTGKTYLSYSIMREFHLKLWQTDKNRDSFIKEAIENFWDPQKRYDDTYDVYHSSDKYTPVTDPRFYNIASIANDLRKEAIDGGDTLKTIIDAKSVIIIDDIGKEKLSEFLTQQLYLIINERYSHVRKTVITSNYSLAELMSVSDGAIASRVSGGRTIALEGTDKRLEG